ncbi:hypothetical protein AAEO56_05195 [Flavobacterium sp. DGU11]|uniref:Uncharacterized protein n=1 Tax=Flavobacterium arundinis TaxID=3139143 RepID=A0ABU9HU09_9FLAO
MEESKLDILGRMDKAALLVLKEEAECFLSNQVESSSIIINKATNIFQINIVIFTSLVGFSINEFISTRLGLLYQSSVIYSCSLFISLLFLLYVVYPYRVYLKGTTPSMLLFEDTMHEESILRNRIFCIERDIERNTSSHSKRVFAYKAAIFILLGGFIPVCINLFLL